MAKLTMIVKTVLLLPILLGTIAFTLTAVLLLFLLNLAFGNET